MAVGSPIFGPGCSVETRSGVGRDEAEMGGLSWRISRRQAETADSRQQTADKTRAPRSVRCPVGGQAPRLSATKDRRGRLSPHWSCPLSAVRCPILNTRHSVLIKDPLDVVAAAV